MARRIRWQIVIAVLSSLFIAGLMGRLALSATSVASPLAGGAYVEAIDGIPRQPIPVFSDPRSDPASHDLAALLFDGLTRIGIDGLPEPNLARSWQIDPSGEVYTFQLRRDVVWHDGERFDADDVIFTIRSVQDRRFQGDPVLANLWRNVLVDRIDDYTIRCDLSAAYSPFPALARMPILPEHILGSTPVDRWSDLDFARVLIGTGPYRLVGLTAQHAMLEANTNYFGEIPFIDNIELRFIESPEAGFSALMRGDVDAFGTSRLPELSLVALTHDLRRVQIPLDEYTILTFNLRQPPLDEPTLRQTLARGLDKDRLVDDATDGLAVRLDTPILPGWWAFDPTASWHLYAPLVAEQELAELGYTRTSSGALVMDDQPLVFELITDGDPWRLAAAESIARQWGELGIAVKIEQLDGDTLRQRLRDRDFAMALHGWTRLGADPDVFELWHSSQSVDGLNYAGLRDETIDRALNNARMEQELVLRSEEYAVFQERWIELTPSITLYQPLYTFFASDRLDGLGFESVYSSSRLLMIGREDRYRGVSRWFVNSLREIRGNLR